MGATGLEILDVFEGLDIIVAVAFLHSGVSGWFPTERVILVDRRLTLRQRWAAVMDELMGNLTPAELDILELWLAPGLDSVATA